MPLDDYGALIRSGMSLVPDFASSQAAQVGLQTEKLRQQLAGVEVLAAQSKQARTQAFQEDFKTALQKPDASSISSLMMKYPEFADQLKSGWDVRDKAAKDADLTHLGELYSAGSTGNWDLLKKSAHARFDADQAAGQADPEDEEFLKAVDSAADGDETQRKAVLGLIGTHLAAVTGPEHFGSVYGALTSKGDYTLDAGATRFDANGNQIAQSPFIKGADGTVYERDGAGVGTSSTPPPATPHPDNHGGFDNAVETVLSNEGGFNPSDMNGAPVKFGINQKANPGVDVKSLTRDDAKQIYHDKYWVPSGAELLAPNLQTPYFDAYIRNPKMAKAALAKSGGDPAKFMDITDAYFGKLAKTPRGQKYAAAWATRDANNRAIATGTAPAADTVPDTPPAANGGAPAGYRVLIPGKQPTRRMLTDAEAASRGLPTNQKYQLDTATGDVSPVAGTQEADEGLDPQTTSFYAQQMLAGGQMPTLGMGKAAAAARQQIMKEVARQAGAEGLSGADLAAQITHYKAATQALKTLETQAGTIQANEETALANGQQFIDRSRELSGQSRFPIVNSVTQSYLRHTGDPTVAAMDAAWNTFTTEYAKVVAGSPSGAGTLSDSARHEAQNTMKGNYAFSQKMAAFKQMQADMANRMAAIHGTIAKKYDQLTKNPRKAAAELSGAAASDLPKGAKVVGTYKGKRVIEVNGKRMVEQ